MNFQSKDGGIEWTHIWGLPGATANAVKGCEHECRWTMPDGTVVICYAETTAERLAKTKAGIAYRQGFNKLSFHPGELDSIQAHKTPCGIFLDSMSDLFGHNVERPWIEAVLKTVWDCPHHVFFSLTKNSRRLLEFGQLPPNLICGISSPPTSMFGKELTAQQQFTWFRKALENLAAAKANWRWVSLEPLSMDFSDLLRPHLGVLDWAVIGAASNGSIYHQPDQDTVSRVLNSLQGVPIFFKGNLSRELAARIGGWKAEWPSQQRWISIMLNKPLKPSQTGLNPALNGESLLKSPPPDFSRPKSLISDSFI